MNMPEYTIERAKVMLTLVNRVTRCEFVVTVRLDIDDLRSVRVAKGFCHGKNTVEGGPNRPFMETGFIGGWSCFNGIGFARIVAVETGYYSRVKGYG